MKEHELRKIQLDDIPTHQLGGETDGISWDAAEDIGFRQELPPADMSIDSGIRRGTVEARVYRPLTDAEKLLGIAAIRDIREKYGLKK